MRHHSVAGFFVIMTMYTATLLAWMVYDGRAAVDVILFYLLGVPIVATAVWWSSRVRQRRR